MYNILLAKYCKVCDMAYALLIYKL